MTDERWAELMFDAAFGGPTREHSIAKLKDMVAMVRSQPVTPHVKVVSAPGDICGGSRTYGGRPCPGCRACS